MRLHVVDGTYELFRAHYSKRPGHKDPSGRDVKATVGLVQSMLGLLEDTDEAVTHLAVAFDNPIVSFRNELFDGYKGDVGIDADLRSQFDLVEEATRAAGIAVWSMDRWEADDALATAATRWADEVDQVRIMTPDKDLGQCLRGEHVVQVDRMRDKVIDEAAFTERRGIKPKSMADFLALVGDSADGIPGLAGFGEKSTATLLAEYEHLEAIPDDGSEWSVKVRGAARLSQTLAAGRQDAMLYRTLATLVTDVPLDHSLEELRWAGVPRARFEPWCEQMGMQRLLERPLRWAE